MGLDTTHNCWHGSYSTFKAFRENVRDAAQSHLGYTPDYDAHPERAFYGWWDKDHNFTDILDVFFIHSDCEGWVFPTHARPLAARLELLVPHVSDDDGWSPEFSTRGRLVTFIAGLRAAADNWEVVVFH
jgi:hypothetical protein